MTTTTGDRVDAEKKRVDLTDLSKFNCIACGSPCEKLTDLDADEGNALPNVGDLNVCFACMAFSTFTEDGLREPTEAERKHIDEDEDLAMLVSAMKAVRAMKDMLAQRPDGEDGEMRAAIVEIHNGPDGPEIVGASTDIPPEVQEALLARLRGDERPIEERVRDFVTADIASWTLAAHGHDDATWPPLSVSALIALIKQADESDDEMFHHLGHVDFFKGYIVATTMAKGQQGIEVLREIAGLPPLPEEPAAP